MVSEEEKVWRGRKLNPRPTAYETAEGGLQRVPSVSNECEIVGDSSAGDSDGSQDLAALTHQFAAPVLTRSERMLSVKEAAGRLSVSTATIYKLCERGLLRHVRVCSAIRIPESALAEVSSRN